MPTRDRAAYMRAYRATRRAETSAVTTTPGLLAAQQRVAELEEEVRRLETLLAGCEAVAARPVFGGVRDARKPSKRRP